ncbi:thyrostimulin beta-5 subunit-like [Diaphorina citri]|uniref:Thyrostimulin beta-5 subunit-like n=2 Tax=Diaphorina citri TaxID=121845 RepID=A0A1S3CVK1_DIACI|nr:thyrostimulin beta-5 subunit-like [Diaphorina citri]
MSPRSYWSINTSRKTGRKTSMLQSTIGFTLLLFSYCAANQDITLDCHRRVYKYRVSQTDSLGRKCWDDIEVLSCWGRCDSNETSDWRFPYKRSHHPVCQHGARALKVVILNNCEENVEQGTEVYRYLEALSCKCSVCKSSEASCEGLRYSSYNSLNMI